MTDANLMFDGSTGDNSNIDYSYWTYDGFHVYRDFNHDNCYDQIELHTDYNQWDQSHTVYKSIDTDYNGIFDLYVTESYGADGKLVQHTKMYDYDENGIIDSSKCYTDTTGNGEFDTVFTTHYDNTDNPEVFRFETSVDTDGDHKTDWKMQVRGINRNGGPNPEYVAITVTDGNGKQISYNELSYEDYCSMGCLNPEQMIAASSVTDYGQFDPYHTSDDKVSGTPGADMKFWEHQGNTGRCAIYAQKFAIEAILGREIPIDELVHIAESHGWFYKGTPILSMDKLLQYYGVNHQVSFDNTIEGLQAALDSGHKVIVSLDSGQIWYGNDNDIFSLSTRVDHAVEVIGIDYNNPNGTMVILNDSGTLRGCGELVPIKIFENAWNAGDAQMIVCYA